MYEKHYFVPCIRVSTSNPRHEHHMTQKQTPVYVFSNTYERHFLVKTSWWQS